MRLGNCHAPVIPAAQHDAMYELRPALPDDAPFLAALEAEVMEAHARAQWGSFHPADLSAFDLSNTRLVHVAGKRIGYVTVEREVGHLRLRKLYLTASHQGQGFGRALLAMVRAEAAAQGLPVRLSVLRANTRALAFYRREGLVVTDTTPDRIFLEAPLQMARTDDRTESAA